MCSERRSRMNNTSILFHAFVIRERVVHIAKVADLPQGARVQFPLVPIGVIGGRKAIWPILLPCASKSPTSVPLVGTSEPLNKGVDEVQFGRMLQVATKHR